MPAHPTSPHLAPTSPRRQGATSAGHLAPRPLPYGGEVHCGAQGEHLHTTPDLDPRGEVRGEVTTSRTATIKRQQIDLLLQAAEVAAITGDAPGTLAILNHSPRWRDLAAELDRMEAGRG